LEYNQAKIITTLCETHLLFIFKISFLHYVLGKNNFVEGAKILLDTDQKIIWLDHQNNFVGTLKIMSKKF